MSTTLFIGFRPMARNRLAISRRRRGHLYPFDHSSITRCAFGDSTIIFYSIFIRFGYRIFRHRYFIILPMVLETRQKVAYDTQVAHRIGTVRRKTYFEHSVVLYPEHFRRRVPAGMSSGNTIMPSCDAPKPNSSSAHIIPKDFFAAYLAFFLW